MNPWGGACVALGLAFLGLTSGAWGLIPLGILVWVVWISWPGRGR